MGQRLNLAIPHVILFGAKLLNAEGLIIHFLP